MGRTSTFVKGRKQQAQRHREQESSKSNRRPDRHLAPSGRTDNVAADATVKRIEVSTAAPKVFPNVSQRAMLIAQPAQAARLPGACFDLCQIIKAASPAAPKETAAAASTGKRARESDVVATTEKQLVQVYAGVKDDLAILLVDESGSNAIVELIRAAGRVAAEGESPLAEQIVDDVMAIVAALETDADAEVEDAAAETPIDADAADTNALRGANVNGMADLATHFSGRAVVWSLIENGTNKQRKRLNKLLAAHALSFSTHRHGCHTLGCLLEHYPKSRKTLLPALVPTLKSTLIHDPVGVNIAERLICAATAADITAALGEKEDIVELVADKRGSRFLVRLLEKGLSASIDDADDLDADAREACVGQVLYPLLPKLAEMAVDPRGNFVVQGLIRCCASGKHAAHLTRIGDALTADKEMPLNEMALHGIGTHVVACLASYPETTKTVTAALKPHILEFVGHKHGSLALRRLIENAKSNAHSVADALAKSIGQHMPTFITHEHGNHVIQAILRAQKPAERSAFFTKFVKPDLLNYAQHQFGSHVVFALLEDKALDAAAHNEMFALLKHDLVGLSQHVNGRFVVERLIGPHREARQLLMDKFTELAFAKGAHHVLVRLYEVSDVAGRKKIGALIGGYLGRIAVNQQGSLSVQKLMQSDASSTTEKAVPAVTQAVREALGLVGKKAGGAALAAQLREDFFGRFVVKAAETA